jgi:hypothetical protein
LDFFILLPPEIDELVKSWFLGHSGKRRNPGFPVKTAIQQLNWNPVGIDSCRAFAGVTIQKTS